MKNFNDIFLENGKVKDNILFYIRNERKITDFSFFIEDGILYLFGSCYTFFNCLFGTSNFKLTTVYYEVYKNIDINIKKYNIISNFTNFNIIKIDKIIFYDNSYNLRLHISETQNIYTKKMTKSVLDNYFVEKYNKKLRKHIIDCPILLDLNLYKKVEKKRFDALLNEKNEKIKNIKNSLNSLKRAAPILVKSINK